MIHLKEKNHEDHKLSVGVVLLLEGQRLVKWIKLYAKKYELVSFRLLWVEEGRNLLVTVACHIPENMFFGGEGRELQHFE